MQNITVNPIKALVILLLAFSRDCLSLPAPIQAIIPETKDAKKNTTPIESAKNIKFGIKFVRNETPVWLAVCFTIGFVSIFYFIFSCMYHKFGL